MPEAREDITPISAADTGHPAAQALMREAREAVTGLQAANAAIAFLPVRKTPSLGLTPADMPIRSASSK